MRADKRSVKHHYIPKAMQKSFATQAGGSNIWYAAKPLESGEYNPPELRNISSTFKEKNLYTVTLNAVPSDVIERSYYGPLDNAIGNLIPKLIDQLSRGIAPVFEGDALNDIRLIMFDMLKRTPDFTKDYSAEKIGKIGIQELLDNQDLALTDFEIEQLRFDLENIGHLNEIGKDAIARARVKPLKKVAEALNEFSVRWGVINGKHSFALSSMGGYRIGNGGHNGLENNRVELWMPISPKYCMITLRDPNNNVSMINSLSTEKVREINEYAVKNGRAIASHSQLLIESLIGKKAKS